MIDLLAQVSCLLAQAADTAISAGGAVPTPEPVSPWLAWISEYGAFFIFLALVASAVGIHVNEDLLLIPAGVLIYEGHLTFPEVFVAAYLGLVLGDTAWIWVCRNFGTRLIHSKRFLRTMHPRKLLEAKRAMDERGAVVLILARFIPGTRTPVLTMTGLLHMPWWKFFAVELPIVAITAPIQITIGWLGKAGFDKARDLGSLVTFGLAGTALAVGIFFAVRWWKIAKARQGPRPRAPVSWLRTFGRNGHRPTAKPT